VRDIQHGFAGKRASLVRNTFTAMLRRNIFKSPEKLCQISGGPVT
jgi:hypothetical protein